MAATVIIHPYYSTNGENGVITLYLTDEDVIKIGNRMAELISRQEICNAKQKESDSEKAQKEGVR